MQLTDYIIILIWLTLTLGVGMWAGLRTSAAGFWVNRRATALLLLITTVVATQVGAGAIVGIAAATQKSGTGFGLVSLMSTCSGFLALAYFAPQIKKFGDKFQAITLPEIFGRRYGRRVQIAAAIVILFTYLSLLAAQFQASSTLLALFTGVKIQWAIVFATAGVIIYSSFAGIRGDIYSDAIHFVAMVGLLLFAGIPSLISKYGEAVFGSGLPADIISPVTFGGWPFLILGLLFGAIIPLLAPELWMKIFASRSSGEARKVFVWASLLVVPFYVFAIMLGFAAHASQPADQSAESTVLKTFFDAMPSSLVGMAIASVLSVILSTANTLVLVVSATVLRDLLGNDPNNEANLKLSRGLSFVAGVVGAGMAFWTGNLVQLLLNTFYGLLALAAALVGGVFWKRATASGAFWSIVSGFTVTLAALPWMPTQAFIPGLLVSIIVFVAVSKSSTHSATELETPARLFD